MNNLKQANKSLTDNRDIANPIKSGVKRKYMRTPDGVAIVGTHPSNDGIFKVIAYTENGTRSISYKSDKDLSTYKIISGFEFYALREVYTKPNRSMEKIMFNDKYGLTKAVLEGQKTVTRRLVLDKHIEKYYSYEKWCRSIEAFGDGDVEIQFANIEEYLQAYAPYAVGETVAVAQRYSEIEGLEYMSSHKGFNNKMFVKSSLMPYQIEIQGVKVERLQDITYDDCLREGVIEMWPQYGQMPDGYTYNGCANMYQYAEEAYADLIDKISGKGTWENNPFVYRIEFIMKRKN